MCRGGTLQQINFQLCWRDYLLCMPMINYSFLVLGVSELTRAKTDGQTGGHGETICVDSKP